jgi:hypothetical protein
MEARESNQWHTWIEIKTDHQYSYRLQCPRNNGAPQIIHGKFKLQKSEEEAVRIMLSI